MLFYEKKYKFILIPFTLNLKQRHKSTFLGLKFQPRCPQMSECEFLDEWRKKIWYERGKIFLFVEICPCIDTGTRIANELKIVMSPAYFAFTRPKCSRSKSYSHTPYIIFSLYKLLLIHLFVWSFPCLFRGLSIIVD